MSRNPFYVDSFSNIVEKTCSQGAGAFGMSMSQPAMSYRRSLSLIPGMARHDEEVFEGKTGKHTRYVPSDFCIKSKVVFRCEESTHWCTNTGADESFIVTNENFEKIPRFDDSNKKYYFNQARLQYVFPDKVRTRKFMNDITSLANQKSKNSYSLEASEHGRIEVFEDRRNRFVSAFRSLYLNLRKGRISYFYLVVENRHQYTILFFYDHADKNPKPKALLCNATRSLRSRLSAANLTFSTPLFVKRDEKNTEEEDDDDEDSDEDEEEDEDEEMGDIQNMGRNWRGVNLTQNIPKTKEKYSSLLLFEGKVEVHRLYDYLINLYGNVGAIKGDIPTILSPTPFKYSILQPVKIRRNDTYLTPKKQRVWILEFVGPILPSTLSKLTYVMSNTQDQFISKITPITHSANLNNLRTLPQLKDILSDNQTNDCICIEDDIIRKKPFSITEIRYSSSSGYTCEMTALHKSDF